MAVGEAESQEESTGGIRPLDFSQPTKFTTEIRRRIVGAFDPLCEALVGSLMSVLKTEVQLSVADVTQHTWASAKARLPVNSFAVAVEERAVGQHMLLSVELPLIMQALECLLGGKAAGASAERHLTDVDWVLAKGLLDTIVGELSDVWSDLGGGELARGEVDLEGDAGVLTPISEPTLAITLESSIEGLESAMTLLIPWGAVEPVAANMHAAGAPSPEAIANTSEALKRGVAGAQVLLRAEVGSVQMGIERMLDLGPGTLVPLKERAEDGVLLFAEGVSLGRGRPGRSGTRRAIKLEATSEPPVHADTYATLGRAELERARAHAHDELESSGEILRSIFVRVWAELGRTHLPIGQALELAPGTVVELEQGAAAPVELFANGLCFANGSLVVTGEGEWGVQIEKLV